MKTKHLLILVCLLQFSCEKEDKIPSSSLTADEISVANEIVSLVNAHRSEQEDITLLSDELAEELAIAHTQYMIGQGSISHDDFQERAEVLTQQGATSVAENVAAGQSDAQAVMNSWLNSSGHRRNIEGDFTHIGVAAIKDAQGRYYYTQVFFKR